ncbi:MAG: LysR family transcriptional regulator [Acetobacteraceae bacterium]|nr:LysR family transcriptional regulator [Acetobacteraceae bacterium]
MALSWDDLKVLLAISRAGSISGAAGLLGVDQSTAGRRLAALEAELGAILFVRSKAGLAPNEAGHAAIARAIEVEQRMLGMSEEVANADEGPVGLVRIYGNPWTVVRLVEVALPALLAQHPRLAIRTIGGPFSRSLARRPGAGAVVRDPAEPDGVRHQARRRAVCHLCRPRRRSGDARLGLLLG